MGRSAGEPASSAPTPGLQAYQTDGPGPRRPGKRSCVAAVTNLGSARVSCAGDGVLAIANLVSGLDDSYRYKKSLFRRDAETGTCDACSTLKYSRHPRTA